MKLANAVEGAVKGVTTLGVITDTLQNMSSNIKPADTFTNGKLKSRLKKGANKKGAKAAKQYIRLAGDLINGAATMGFAKLGKKKNAMVTGALLGTAAGLGTLIFKKEKEEEYLKIDGKDIFPGIKNEKTRKVLHQVLHVSLYTMGGLFAGKIVEQVEKAGRKKKRKK